MSKAIKITLFMALLAVILVVGYPLTREGSAPGYAEAHPGETARCYYVGDMAGFIKCALRGNPRLAGPDMVNKVVNNMNLTTYPFGYLFLISLALFIAVAIILI